MLSVQVADCVPILIADRRTGSAAAIHAGWRGTCAGIAGAATEAMVKELGSDPANLVAAIGPSIGPCCYEVGASVLDAFRRAGVADRQLGRWFTATDAGSLRLDLWAANRDQLVRAGLRPDQVSFLRALHADAPRGVRVLPGRWRTSGPHDGADCGALIRTSGPDPPDPVHSLDVFTEAA